VFGEMQQRDGIERRTKHQHFAPRLNDLLEWRSFTVPILKRMFTRDPSSQGTDGNHSRIGMIAAQRARPRSQRFMQHAMIPRRMRNPFVENRDLFIAVFVKRLEIDVSRQRSALADRIEQRLHYTIHPAGDRTNGTHAGVHHQHVSGVDT